MSEAKRTKGAVVAFGGNVLIGQDGKGSYENQMKKAEMMCGNLIKLFKLGYRVVITHGNGPQVGNFLMQQECLSKNIPPMPLDVCNAMTQGQIGYMIEQKLRGKFVENNIKKSVVTFITQVVVSQKDPAFSNPTKFIGPFFTKRESEKLRRKAGWEMKEDSDRGYRRVVPSPMPIDIVEKDEIREMVRRDVIVIASGGGGIPVFRDKNGKLKGTAAVIDKDFAAEMLASLISAEILLLITPVEQVSIFYGTSKQKDLRNMSLDEAKRYLAEGHFPSGSMGPKIEASIKFLNSGGKRTIITSLEALDDAISNKRGTVITH
ncbi:MAG: carbamate kinase [Thermodesulfobacteriota bacterium]